mgnify:CR=1 FL=1
MAQRNVISKVEYTSPLYGKVKVGDALISINDHPIKDVLDYKYYGYDHRLSLQILTAEGKTKKLRVRKSEGEDLGLEFATYLMDAPRSCANRCVFCFIDQNPPGMRKSIYFKDDDARLSFLMGCYITLTNLKKEDIEVYNAIEEELKRQQNKIELIASENFTSKAVMEAMGSYMTNKYAEGYLRQ